jgi:hypothetical protein
VTVISLSPYEKTKRYSMVNALELFICLMYVLVMVLMAIDAMGGRDGR